MSRGAASPNLPSSVDSDWVRVVASLIRLTEEGKLRWKSEPASGSLERDPQKVDVVFTSEYEGKKLRLYVVGEKVEEPGYPFSLFSVGRFKRRYPYQTREVVLELGDKAERGWYTIPETHATEDLLESVKYQVIGVDDFLNRVLEAP